MPKKYSFSHNTSTQHREEKNHKDHHELHCA